MMYTQEQYDALLAVCRSYRQDVERLEKNMRSLIEAEKKRAVKEFAEKLKEKALSHCRVINCYELTFIETTINDLLKEYEK